MTSGGGSQLPVQTAPRNAFSSFTYGLLATFVLVLLVAGVLSAHQDWRGFVVARMAKAQSAVLASEDHVSQTMQLIENVVRTLQFSQDKPLANTSVPELERLLQRMQYSLPAIRSLSLVDSEFRIVASSNPANRGALIDGEAFVRAGVASSGPTRLRIAPLWMGRDFAQGKPQASEAALAEKAPFFFPVMLNLGPGEDRQEKSLYALVAVNPDYLLGRLSRYLSSEAESFDVVLRTGQVLLSSEPGKSGRAFELAPWWNHRGKSHAELDTGDQLLSMRASEIYPLYVAMQVDRQQVWEEWKRLKLPYFGWISAAVVAALLACAMLFWRVRLTENHQRGQQRLVYRLSQALEQSPSGIVITDLQGLVEYSNTSYSRMVDRPLHEIVAHVTYMMDVRVVPATMVAELQDCLLQGKVWSGEYTHRRPGQEDLEVNVLWSPLRDERGWIRHFIGIEYDISSLKRLQRELGSARDRAEAAVRARTEFLANMSHEVRTPMSGVIGMTQLALDEDMGEKAREFVEHARTSAVNLLGILNDILDFSKMEAGKLQLESARFEVRPWLESMTRPHAMTASDKGLAFECEVSDSVPRWIISDALRMSQVINNLLSNAIKFTASGRVGLRLRAQKAHTFNGREWMHLFLVVDDSGCGMSAAELRGLFQPFVQANSSTSRLYGGTGLGLVISRRLCQAMQGDIQVRSESGRGSSFEARLLIEVAPGDLDPRPPASDQASRISPSPKPGPKVSHPGLAGKRVLLVEDHPFNRQMMIAMLTKPGVVVESAVNGEDAIAKLAQDFEGFAAVLMDIQMPVMDGIEATRRIRAMPGWSQVPIIAVTANALQDEKDLCLAAGMQDYLVKPVDQNTLYDKLLIWVTSSAQSNVPQEQT